MPLSSFMDWLLPPASLAPLALLLVVFGRRWLAGLVLAVLVALSMPVTANALFRLVDPGEPVIDAVTFAGLPPSGPAPGAIVILSAELVPIAGGGFDVGPLTLERLRAGVALERRTHLPVLVTGGVVENQAALGPAMAHVLQDEYGITPRWVEDRSRTTWENADFSVPLLKQAGIGRIYLVTHEWHMRRSLMAFRRAGIEAVPVVVRNDAPRWNGAWSLVPRASSWLRSYFALHEWLGLLYYQHRSA